MVDGNDVINEILMTVLDGLLFLIIITITWAGTNLNTARLKILIVIDSRRHHHQHHRYGDESNFIVL